jgi:formylglycine-generating enzyme required for sulfatase activity
MVHVVHMNLLPQAAFVAFSSLAVTLAGPRVAVAQVDPNSGTNFITIGAPGNIAYNRDDPFNRVAGRGGVGYEYRIGRMEVTTGQWLDFANAALARSDPFFINLPIAWGAERDTSYQGPGERYRLRNVPDAAMLPVGGISWREAAYYCNWLHNDKNPARTSFENGAYDASTFNGTGFPTWTDQPTRHPDARYFIPTWDEWLKAVHYDPSRTNDDGTTGGWWLQPNGTDIPLTYGLPPSLGGSPLNQSNAGVNTGQGLEYLVPLAAYPNVATPWGLLDASGGSSEWTEGIFADAFFKAAHY